MQGPFWLAVIFLTLRPLPILYTDRMLSSETQVAEQIREVIPGRDTGFTF